MNPDLLNEINSLVLEYKTKRNRDILEKIQRKLIHLEFQSDVLRSNLGIIENPELKYFDYEFKKYHSKFSYSNALSKYHIIIPLLMYYQNFPGLTGYYPVAANENYAVLFLPLRLNLQA